MNLVRKYQLVENLRELLRGDRRTYDWKNTCLDQFRGTGESVMKHFQWSVILQHFIPTNKIIFCLIFGLGGNLTLILILRLWVSILYLEILDIARRLCFPAEIQ